MKIELSRSTLEGAGAGVVAAVVIAAPISLAGRLLGRRTSYFKWVRHLLLPSTGLGGFIGYAVDTEEWS
ncbi:MAG: hypothetical protein K0S68_99 [Candidatus Saccharibacteria bacterium]|jgi:hypothetical protein|nr:hypothetical protein [Candidatus Saccharibacteria bacterium]